MTLPSAAHPTVTDRTLDRIREQVSEWRESLIRFLREICAIPSADSQIGPVGQRVAQELRQLGYDEVRFDRQGNLLGRIGDGPRILLYDSHLDTVGVGDPAAWAWDPFQGKVEDGTFYARGAGDEKGSTPGMVYGLALARDLGLLEGWTAYYFGNMEEWCDGIAGNVLVEVEGIRPDCVVIGEPTDMHVFRGQKGRVEIRATARGRSAHAASNWLGDNAVYKMLPFVASVRDLDAKMAFHDFLGRATVSVTEIVSASASINAVPDLCSVVIDRRLILGESKEQAVAQVQALIPDGTEIALEILRYDEPSYTGFVFPLEKVFPAWLLEESHPLVQAGLTTGERLWGERRPTGRWDFSTNGTYWMGKAGIPSIGFGPGEEKVAHTVLDRVSLDDMVRATGWYALLPAMIP